MNTMNGARLLHIVVVFHTCCVLLAQFGWNKDPNKGLRLVKHLSVIYFDSLERFLCDTKNELKRSFRPQTTDHVGSGLENALRERARRRTKQGNEAIMHQERRV